MQGNLWELLGVFVAAATPFIEGESAVSIGILAGLPPVAVILVGILGNLLTVGVAAFLGTKIHRRLRLRSQNKTRTARQEKRHVRTQRVFSRWGLPGLAILGPPALGTQLAAMTAVSLGVEPRKAFLWVGAATLVWCLTAASLALMGVSFWEESGRDLLQMQSLLTP